MVYQGKGKGNKDKAPATLKLVDTSYLHPYYSLELILRQPSGEPATIKWVTVGGRTSAYVVELQQLPNSSVIGSGVQVQAIKMLP